MAEQRTNRYADRRDAGRVLAGSLASFANHSDVVVLALPRGGIPVGYEVARALDAPLDVFVVRKLGLPSHPELAMGAIASGGVRVLNDDVLAWYRPSPDEISAVTRAELAELTRREGAYRGPHPPQSLHQKIVILVDDGLATGATMRAAVMAVGKRDPARIVVAVPVGARETCQSLSTIAEVICPWTPDPFDAVGLWYEDFTQTSDSDVHELLEASRAHTTRVAHDQNPGARLN